MLLEAAGLGKFKARRHRAELKLARVATQAERARDVEEEVRKRLRPLALQASAAERAEKLIGELARLHARIAQLDLAALDERRAKADERRQAVSLARRDVETKLEALLEERNRVEDELADAAGKREEATRRSTGCAARASGWRCGARPPMGCCATSRRSRAAARVLDERVRAEREALAERSVLEERLTALERSLAEREACRRRAGARRTGRTACPVAPRRRAGDGARGRRGFAPTCIRACRG